MIDVCLITEGAWPLTTGGLSTWTRHFVHALEGMELGVVSLPLPGKRTLREEVPSHVHFCESTDTIAGVPEARQYIASGLGAAEWLLERAPELAPRLVYVEHGDLTRELLEFGATEGGRFVQDASRKNAARLAHQARAALTRRVGLVAGVTRRTYRRVLADGTRRAIHVPNAVPPSHFARASSNPRRLGFVGRNARIKGLDRFVDLCERFDFDATACVLGQPAAEQPAAEQTASEQNAQSVRWHFNHQDPWSESFSALLMPSRLEACPFVALEAEARGIPVLLSDVADIEDSALITRLPWDVELWGTHAKRIAGPPRPEQGRRLAAARWQTFKSQWRNIAERTWATN